MGRRILHPNPAAIRARRPIKIGDIERTVQAVQTRATMVKTYSGRLVIVPNSDIYTRSGGDRLEALTDGSEVILTSCVLVLNGMEHDSMIKPGAGEICGELPLRPLRAWAARVQAELLISLARCKLASNSGMSVPLPVKARTSRSVSSIVFGVAVFAAHRIFQRSGFYPCGSGSGLAAASFLN